MSALPEGGETDDARLLALIRSLYGLLDLDEFRRGLITALERAVPCDWVSINEFDESGAPVATIVAPNVSSATHAGFARLGHQNPIVQRYLRTNDARACRLSDLVSRGAFHRLPLYRDVYAEIGLEYQMAFMLEDASPRLLGVALNRKHEDFSDGERAFAERARPLLAQGYRNAVEHARARDRGGANALGALDAELRARGLTARETSVVRRVAAGRSSRDAGSELGVSDRTVQKHLERAFRKLGVSTRSQAATEIWALAERAIAHTPD